MGINAQTSVPKFTSGDVLTAANTNLLTNAPPVFSGTATRDAAFDGAGEKTLAEGQLCYLEDSDIVQYYSGSGWLTVGPSSAAGLVPIVPTSVAVGSGSASVSSSGLITFTTVGTNLSINGAFSATYRNYLMQHNLSTTGNAQNFGLRLRVGGTDNTSASYNMTGFDADPTTLVIRAAAAETSFNVLYAVDNDNAGNTANTHFFQPFETKATTVNGQGLSPVSTLQYRNVFGSHSGATSFDGCSFIINSGTITGTVMIYGYSI
jgi:hypothetical protein